MVMDFQVLLQAPRSGGHGADFRFPDGECPSFLTRTRHSLRGPARPPPPKAPGQRRVVRPDGAPPFLRPVVMGKAWGGKRQRNPESLVSRRICELLPKLSIFAVG